MSSHESEAPPAAAGDPTPAPGDQNAAVPAGVAAPGSVPSTASSSTRVPYVPQFSATTELILQRIRDRAESSHIVSAVPPVGSSPGAGGIQQSSSYEDTRRRLMNSMNTSLALSLPAPAHVPPQLSLRGPAFVQESPSVQQPTHPAAVSARGGARGGSKRLGRPPHGLKRKRGKYSSEERSDRSDHDSSDEKDGTYQDTPVTTKSGRQVSKPVPYNPSTPSTTGKRKHYGKRTPEQALCKVCTRGLSPMSNQIVFCDGCNACWHQLCHDPAIGNEFVSDEARAWFCRGCLAKRERSHGGPRKRVSTEGARGVSWAVRSPEQRQAYLRGLTRQELLNLLLYSVELHPDLPIFPTGEANGASRTSGPGSFVRGGTGSSNGGQMNFIRKVSSPSASSNQQNGNPAIQSAAAQNPTDNSNNNNTEQEQEDSDAVPPAWPKVGQGVLDTAGIKLRDSDFEDNDDYEAFSVMTFDRQGRKIMKNGKPVTKENDGERERKLRNELT